MKDKTSAIFLAVFLGVFTWLYTYNANKKKFWWGLGIAFFGMFILGGLAPLGVYVWSIFDAASTDKTDYKKMR